MAKYPIFLDLNGRRVVIIGGGSVATRKAETILGTGARLVVVAPRLDETLRKVCSGSKAELIESKYSKDYIGGATLVIAATNDEALNRQIYKDCQQLEILCNVVDSPGLCDFYVPAVVQRGDFHNCIVKAFEFDGKHSASFYVSDEKWQYGMEFNSEVLINKKGAPALSMTRTPVSALISTPDQRFIYVYNPEKKWTFLVQLIGVSKEETPRRIYPFVLRKEGIAPAQYGIKGVNPDKLMEIEEKYDVGVADMEEVLEMEYQ